MGRWLDREAPLGWILAGPVVLLLLGLVAYPFGVAIQYALSDRTLAEPSRSGVEARHLPSREELEVILRDVRAKGWAATDEQLARGVRSVAVPLRNGEGRVVAAVNVTVHAAETSMDTLLGSHLPLLLRTAADISADFASRDALPLTSARTVS